MIFYPSFAFVQAEKKLLTWLRCSCWRSSIYGKNGTRGINLDVTTFSSTQCLFHDCTFYDAFGFHKYIWIYFLIDLSKSYRAQCISRVSTIYGPHRRDSTVPSQVEVLNYLALNSNQRGKDLGETLWQSPSVFVRQRAPSHHFIRFEFTWGPQANWGKRRESRASPGKFEWGSDNSASPFFGQTDQLMLPGAACSGSLYVSDCRQ